MASILHTRLRAIAWFVCVAGHAALGQQALLTTVGEIRYLSLEEAAQARPVQIEAQITNLHPRRHGAFLFDGKVGVFARLPEKAGLFDNLKPGSLVRVSGLTTPGGFSPDITVSELEVVGWRPLPVPRRFQPHEVMSPATQLDCEWVAVMGRLVGATILKEQDHVMLELEIHKDTVDIQIPYTEDAEAKVAELIFQRVDFPAVAGTVYNRHRQLTGRVFFVNSFDAFTPNTEGEEWVDQDVRPIETLMRMGANYQKLMHTRGTVTYADGQVVYLRGVESCIKVATFGGTRLQPGDYVDMLGFIWPQPISPAFRARKATLLEKRPAPLPRAIRLGEGLDPDWNYELVTVDVELVDMGKAFGMVPTESGRETVRYPGQSSLLCRSGGRLFEAKLPPGTEIPDRFSPGARLRLTGICNLVANNDPRWQYFTESLWMQLGNVDDVVVLVPAPWWTAARLLWMAGLSIGTALLFLGWVVLLRKTVASQTALIGRQIERESILDERQRIARELHDTLEQALAGLALQLQSCLRQLDVGVEKGRDALKLAQGMLRYCRDESRSSILDLRGGLLEKMDLPSALRESIQPLADECGAKVEVEVQGVARRFKPFAERHLLRVAKEAATNAVRHAKPSVLSIRLRFEPAAFQMEVADDGGGFDAASLHKSERFGLQGMHERINRLHGTLSVESVPGQGTTVGVQLSSTREWELE